MYNDVLSHLDAVISNSKVKVIGQSSPSQEDNAAKVVCVTSSEGFLVDT